MTRLVVIDNYDSFTYNLVHAFAGLGAHVDVHRNDAITHPELAKLAPDGIVLSPGPGHPGNAKDFGVCAELIRQPLDAPMLGVCLGMQGMAHHTGGHVVQAADIVHGESDTFAPASHPIFANTPPALEVARYHSLRVDEASLPSEWEPLGSTSDGTLMAMAHRSRPWVGLQFHPESILTPDGPTIARNFLDLCT